MSKHMIAYVCVYARLSSVSLTLAHPYIILA
jgi:hypothetical protein